MEKHPGGRPSTVTPEAVAKLEEAFSNGATDLEACFLANISKDALYRYQKEHPEFRDRKEGLKNMVKYQARKNIVRKIKAEESGDKVDTSQWYAERKMKDEFSTKTETDLTSGGEKIDGLAVSFKKADK